MREVEKNHCPMCGQTVASPRFLVSPTTNEVSFAGATVKITPIQAKLLTCLVRAWPGGVPHEQIATITWADYPPSYESRTVAVHIHRIRKAFKDMPGVRVESISGFGYKLVLPANVMVTKENTRRRQSVSGIS